MRRFLMLFLLVPLIAVGASGSSRSALLPTGSCYDAKYWDGLETEPSATYCKNALVAAGYNGASYHNVSARQELSRVGTDAVFFFNGHAVVSGTTSLAAQSLVYEFQGPAGPNLDFLAGEALGLEIQGPIWTLCNEGQTACKKTTNQSFSYPWIELLGKHNLVVLEGCNTAGSNTFAPVSMAALARDAGAGTVIGFKDLIACPLSQTYAYCIKWAGVFWTNLQNGVDYSTAAIAASNAVGCCGFSSVQILKNTAAPTTLRPASYYPRVGQGPAVSTNWAAATDPRTAAVETWLGRPVQAHTRWISIQQNGRTRYQSLVRDVGLVQVDADSLEVVNFIFSPELTRVRASAIGGLVRENTATSFARQHFSGFDDLRLRERATIDHGLFAEDRFVWQARAGLAWLPTKVTVGVNSATGRVVYFSSERRRLNTDARTHITSEQARSSAARATGFDGQVVSTTPSLEVMIDPVGGQRLVWITELSHVESGPHLPHYDVVWTDAHTGTSEVVARS
jgi:hypothetical protein